MVYNILFVEDLICFVNISFGMGGDWVCIFDVCYFWFNISIFKYVGSFLYVYLCFVFIYMIVMVIMGVMWSFGWILNCWVKGV